MALDWIKKIEPHLLELEERPQFGLPIPFPKERLEGELKKSLGLSSLELKYVEKGWVDSKEHVERLRNMEVLPLRWAPVFPAFFWGMEIQEIKSLMAIILGGEQRSAPFLDTGHVQSFHQYLALEVLRDLEMLQFASLQLGEPLENLEEMLSPPFYLIETTLSIGGHSFHGLICIPEPFRASFKQQVAAAPAKLSDEWLKNTMVEASLTVGDVQLFLSDWKRVQSGDLIVLDRCSYDPVEKKGSVLLSLEGNPLFRARIKEDGIKLSEYPTYEEVEQAMTQESEFDSEEEKNIYGDLEEEEDLFAPPPPPPEETTPPPETKQPAQAPAEEPKGMPPPTPPPSGEKREIGLEQIPVRLTVEVARLRITARELMDLAPGNLLNLQVSPEQGVDLVLNGKKVGKGELIRMGETLGVRILSLVN